MVDITQKPENKQRVEEEIRRYQAAGVGLVANEKVREPKQSFWDAIRETDIASMENGDQVLRRIKDIAGSKA